TLEEIGPARYAFDTSGKPGAWRIQTATDKKVSGYPFTKVESFVRFENAPLVIAMDDPDRLFEVDVSAPKPARLTELPAIDADQPFIEGRLGQGIALKSSAIVELPQIPPAPVGQGTVEF